MIDLYTFNWDYVVNPIDRYLINSPMLPNMKKNADGSGSTISSLRVRGAGVGMALLGALSLVLGGVLLCNTLVSVAMLPWIIGIAELVGGMFAFFFAFRLLSIQTRERR